MGQNKTADLCQRCMYECHRCKGACEACDHQNEHGSCLCLTVLKNTPCPYFKEADND